MQSVINHKRIRVSIVLLFTLLLSAPNAHAQELRIGLEYQGQITKKLFVEPGVETRYFQPYSLNPDRLLFDLSAGYKFGNHWKLKSGFRYRTGKVKGEEILSSLDDKNRITLDGCYKRTNKNKTGSFQCRIRYQLSEGKDEYKDYYRLRLKWEHKKNKDFKPFFSTEVIFSDFKAVPHSCRLRTGIEIRTSDRTETELFYQAEISTKEKYEIMHFVLGCQLKISTK